MEERAKRVVHLEHAMAQVKKQLDDHNSGVKNFEERRLKSLRNRLQSYKGHIFDASRELSPEVRFDVYASYSCVSVSRLGWNVRIRIP